MYQPCQKKKKKESFYGGLSLNLKPVSMPVQYIYIAHLLSIIVPVAAKPILESVEHLVGLCILMGKERSTRRCGIYKNKEGKNLHKPH